VCIPCKYALCTTDLPFAKGNPSAIRSQPAYPAIAFRVPLQRIYPVSTRCTQLTYPESFLPWTFQIYLQNQPTLIISTYKSNPKSPKKGKEGMGGRKRDGEGRKKKEKRGEKL
jgi:hypothetical protein